MNSAVSAIIRHYEIIPKIFGSSGALGIFFGYVIASMIGTAIIHGCYDQIPQRHRNIHHTWMLWLLLFPLPLLSWYLIFSSTVGLSRSFKRAFADIGDDSAGSCGITMSFIFAFNLALLQVPVLTPFLLPFLPVTGLVWLSQMSNLRSKLRSIDIESCLPQPIEPAFAVGSLPRQPNQSLASAIAARARQGLANPYGEGAGLEHNGAKEKQGLSTSAWWLIVLVLVVAAAIMLIRMRNAQEREDHYNQRTIQHQYYR